MRGSRRADVVVVDNRMQTGYSYLLTEPRGRNFDPECRPQLTPEEMLALGVFCGKYMTDCQREFPELVCSREAVTSGPRLLPQLFRC